MPHLSYLKALNRALSAEMERDPAVCVFGEDIGIAVREQTLKDEDLFGADEAFLTSTTRELVPISHVDTRTVGNGRPGPVTKTLLQAFRRKAHEGDD